jgi:hypothetical protein
LWQALHVTLVVAALAGLSFHCCAVASYGRALHQREHAIEMLGHLLGPAGPLSRLHKSAKHLAAMMHGKFVDGRPLLLPQQGVVRVRVGPCGCAVGFRQTIGEYRVTAARDCGRSLVARGLLRRFGKRRARGLEKFEELAVVA